MAIGNAICGNSAIAAAAPVLEAEAGEVAAAIAFTAILGIVVVLVLPFAGMAMSLDDYEHGVVAGLTVYAVPQVLAATLPVSILSAEVGTLVKLTRVLLLGPALVVMGIWARRSLGVRGDSTGARVPLVPWFVAGFVVMAMLRAIRRHPGRMGGAGPGDVARPHDRRARRAGPWRGPERRAARRRARGGDGRGRNCHPLRGRDAAGAAVL